MPPKVKIDSHFWVVEKQDRVEATASVASLSDEFPNASKPPVKVLIQVRAAAIYFTVDGDDPTSSIAFEGQVGDLIELDEPFEIANFKFIEQTGTPYVNYIFYQERGGRIPA